MITIDGSIGEGGGQILRSALSLSLVTGEALQVTRIRAARAKPGLQAQHLAAVRAAAMISQAGTEGASLHSQELMFRPQKVTPGEYAFDIGTAGSATLLLQTLLPALILASGPSALVVEGGTHNPLAPPFEFLAKTFLPLIHSMGPVVRAKLDRHGFYPAGGGKMRVTIQPATKLSRIELLERGAMLKIRGTALLAQLPRHVADRELKVLRRELDIDPSALRVEEVKSRGPGNALLVEIESVRVTEVMAGFGELGVKAEIVAGRTAKEARRYLQADVPVGEYLADQLLLPMALAGGGSFVTLPLSRHTLTNLEVIEKFLAVKFKVETVSDEAVRIEVVSPG